MMARQRGSMLSSCSFGLPSNIGVTKRRRRCVSSTRFTPYDVGLMDGWMDGEAHGEGQGARSKYTKQARRTIIYSVMIS